MRIEEKSSSFYKQPATQSVGNNASRGEIIILIMQDLLLNVGQRMDDPFIALQQNNLCKTYF